MSLTRDQMYLICKMNDSDYDGSFYMAVYTTGIYCLPSCPARIPYLKNVTFYKTKEQAIENGFRGCKRCKSAEFPYRDPDIETVYTYISTSYSRVNWNYVEKLAKLPRKTLDRRFMKNYGTSISKMSRRIRLQKAKELILEGVDILRVPYRCGFNSVSGFRKAFQNEFGRTPAMIRVKDNE